MVHEVKIPTLGESITSGILSRWAVSQGAVVRKGQLLYELETDKITSEGLAETSGAVETLVEEGAEVLIGQTVARIDDAVAAIEESSPANGSGNEASASFPVAPETPKPGLPLSPAVERIAGDTGVNPATLQGTGKGGRVTKGDMLVASSTSQEERGGPDVAITPPAPQVSSAPVPGPKAAAASGSKIGRRHKMSPLRRKIAERLVESQKSAAILTTFNEVDMSAVMRVRAEVQESFVAAHGVKLGFMSFFVKAVVKALQDIPQVNASIEGEEVITYSHFDIGVAVGTEKGLVVPVVRDCDQMSMAGIEKELGRFAKLAREGKIGIGDLQGGVFTISNGGVYGSLLSTPIINPPQSGILGMHTIKDRPVVVDGQVVIRPMMYLALSYDHRLVDGKEAVGFLVSVKESIEKPSRLLLGI